MTAAADRDDDTAQAGEYVLGLLDAAEARAFEARLGREPQLRAAVAEFSESFATLTDGIAPLLPPSSVKAALDRRLFTAPAPRMSLGRLIFGGLSGALAVLALVMVLPLLAPPRPDLQAEIATDSLVVLASLDLDTGLLSVERTVGAPPAGRSLELWLIPQGETAPISLGVIDAATSERAVPPDLAGRFRDGTLAISEEPLGGSPTGAPTLVLGAGAVTLL